jgi:four helix bundle protein
MWERRMGGSVTSYKELRVWQEGLALSLLVYRLGAKFSKGEQFGLTSQVRRSAVSVPSNIAEGYGRGSRVEYLRFLKIARGSLFELEKVEASITVCNKLLAGLIRRLEQD